MELLNDFQTSVRKAFNEIDPAWESYDGLVVCGTHNPRNVEGMIEKIRYARENYRQFLGICFGHQIAFIEYCRNVLGIKDATSEEFGKGTFVVKKLPKLKVGIHQVDGSMESFWNNYEIDENIKWYKPKHFLTTQFHPEYSEKHPLLVDFISMCKKKTPKKMSF